MNDTFKIKNTYFHRFSVIFSSMCSYFSAMSWMILSKDLDRSRYVMNLRKWTTLLKLKKHISTVFLSSSVLCAHISLLYRGWYCQYHNGILNIFNYFTDYFRNLPLTPTDIANIMMEYLTYLIFILIIFETSLSEVILYLCLIWSHIKLQYLSTYQKWYLCL